MTTERIVGHLVLERTMRVETITHTQTEKTDPDSGLLIEAEKHEYPLYDEAAKEAKAVLRWPNKLNLTDGDSVKVTVTIASVQTRLDGTTRDGQPAKNRGVEAMKDQLDDQGRLKKRKGKAKAVVDEHGGLPAAYDGPVHQDAFKTAAEVEALATSPSPKPPKGKPKKTTTKTSKKK